MTSKTNTFEGQPSGTAWVYTDSGGGSGDAFSAPNTSGTVTVTYDTTQAFNGALSLHMTAAATSQYIIGWTGLNGPSLSARFYIRIVSSSAAQDIVQFRNGSGQAAAIGLSSGRVLQIKNALGGALTTGWTGALALNTWYRIEMSVTKGVATSTPFDGTVTAAYYLGDSTTPVETAFTSNTVNTGTGNLVWWRFGKLTSAPTFEAFFDSIGISDTTATPLGTYARTGSGVGAVTVTGNGVGSKAAAGSGVGALTLTNNGTGVKRAAGAGVSALTVTSTGVGGKRAAGAGVALIALTGNGTGRKTGRGSGASPLTVTGGGTGTKRVSGSGISLLTITGNGQGAAVITPPDIRYGSGMAVLNLAGGGSGRKSTAGSGASLLTITGGGTSTKRVAGSGVSLLYVIGDGIGTRVIGPRDLTFTAVLGGQSWHVSIGSRSWLVSPGVASWFGKIGDPMELSSLSVEFVTVRFTSSGGNGSDAVVFDTQPVYLALVQDGFTPSPSDFFPAEWVGAPSTSRWARVLVGPGSGVPTFAAGVYEVWGRVQDTTEVAVRKVGAVTVV